jgi:energy-coupling factor transporter ATP-binding protein EcfA2
MPTIKVTKMEFRPDHAFRKFKDLTIPIAPRLTVVCGHNGVGKSTILGILSSLSGLTGGEKSYFGKTFDASIAEIVYIDHPTEVAAKKAAGTLCEPLLHYSLDGIPITKECSLTKRGASARARVVSRNYPHKIFTHAGVTVGPDAKVPLPTMYLGMVRMLPIGESPDGRVHNNVAEIWHPDDEAFMLNFVKRVIPGAGAKAGAIAVNRVTHTGKLSTHPSYPYGPRSVSLGQDSLGAIVTALASFYRLKRSLGTDYSGGLLVIDELDAGFHPHAINVLITELRKAADELNLQVVATSHSTRLIEAVHPDGPSKGVKLKDSVIYLRNTRAPEYDPSFGLADILQDMDLTPPKAKAKPPEIKVYFEDDEACEVFNILTPRVLLKELEKAHGVSIKPMPLGIGCSSLAMLPSKDAYFKTVVLVVDADGQRPTNVPENLVELPGGLGDDGKGLSPERTLIKYIRELVNEPTTAHPLAWGDARLRKFSTDSLEANLLTGYDDPLDRKRAKLWWKEKNTYIREWGLYEIWAKVNLAAVATYHQRLAEAVKVAAKARRSQEVLAKRGL